MSTQAEVVDYIKNLKLSEVKDLITILEDELGVEASAPIAVGAIAAPAAAEAAEEQTEFDVVLTDYGANKIKVIKAVRSATGLGLKEAKDLVEGTPSTIKEAVDKANAEEVKKALEEAGGKVELK